jgi:hypothetical protein
MGTTFLQPGSFRSLGREKLSSSHSVEMEYVQDT